MAQVLSLKKEKKTAKEKVEGFLTRYRALILLVSILIVIAALAVCIAIAVSDSLKKKDIAALDAIEYEYTKEDGLSDEVIVKRQADALEALVPYLSKKGTVGVQANKLAADISFAKKDYMGAADYYIAVALAGKKDYNRSAAYFNAAVCYEELSNIDDAVKYYTLAADDEEFLLASHALFNVGRLQEASGNMQEAGKAYQKVVDSYASDTWANLAQSRLIVLKTKGSL